MAEKKQVDEKKAPVTLKQGMPPEQKNGMFGNEERLMALGVKGRFTAVTVIEINDIVHSEKDGTTRPIVELVHIEPIWSEQGITDATKTMQDQYKVRTGANQLDLDDAPAAAADDEQAAKDTEFEAAAPKGGK